MKKDTLQTIETSPCQFFLNPSFCFLCFSPVPQNSVHCSAVILKSEREPKLSAVHWLHESWAEGKKGGKEFRDETKKQNRNSNQSLRCVSLCSCFSCSALFNMWTCFFQLFSILKWTDCEWVTASWTRWKCQTNRTLSKSVLFSERSSLA